MKRFAAIIILLIRFSLTSNSLEFVFTPINAQQGLSDNQVRYIIQLRDGRMVFRTSGNINIYDGSSFKYIHQDSRHNYSLNGYNGFYRIYQTGDSLLWIKDYKKLTCVDLRKERYIADLHNYFRKSGFKHEVDDLFLDSEQRLWLRSGGRLTLKDRSLVFDVSKNEGILQDVEAEKGCLYLFYDTGKVLCYDVRTKKILYAANAYPTAEKQMFHRTSLVVKGKNGFYQLRNGNMGGFFFFDLQKRKWEKILQTHYTLNTLVVDADGTASISCPSGLWIVGYRGVTKTYLPTVAKTDGTKLDTEISTLFYDKQGGLWLGTANQGLLYHHPNRYAFKSVGRAHFSNKSAKDIIVKSFAEDDKGSIYLKSQHEFYRFKEVASGNVSLELADIASIPAKTLQKLNYKSTPNTSRADYPAQLTDNNGWSWTGTADGLRVFDPVARKQHVLYTKDGLSNNFIQAIMQDRANNIWVTTSYGINKVRVEINYGKINIRSFDSDSGTLEGEYSRGSAFQSASGRLYFGGINGFSIMEPNSPLPNQIPFAPLFTNLYLKGERILLGKAYDGRIILDKGAPYTESIGLSYDQNFLTFEFSALNFQNASQTYYRYQLEGIDKKWREVLGAKGSDNLDAAGILKLSYPNLPSGKYKLKVLASNNNLDWKRPVTVLSLTIEEPWWKTGTAYVFFALIASVIIGAGIYGYQDKIKKNLEQSHREEILLLKIRNLIEQQHLLQDEKEVNRTSADPNMEISESAATDKLNQADSIFISKAMVLVEKNLHEPGYSVDQLSRDLNMERTGLYRKLIALLDKPPSLFIRNIRIEKAAELIVEGKLNISEIADRVGFSSSSYLSKCFQERYGCRPSEYVEHVKKST